MKRFVLLIIFLLFVGMANAAPDDGVSIVLSRVEVLKPDADKNGKRVHKSTSVFPLPSRDGPAGDTVAWFKVSNETNEPVVIYGVAYDSTFQPFGFLHVLKGDSRVWELPTPARRAGELDRLRDDDKRVLNPGESFEFSAVFSRHADGKKRFRRTIYYSFPTSECPKELVSNEFSIGE